MEDTTEEKDSIKEEKNKEKKGPNYKTLFILGIVFMISGVSFTFVDIVLSIPFFGLGLLYLIISLANKDNW